MHNIISRIINRSTRQEILKLKRVSYPLEDRFSYLMLDKNERIIPFPDNYMDELLQRIKFIDIAGYYELSPIYRKLAKYLNVDANQILLASGSDLAIRSIYECMIERGDNIVLQSPSYAMYHVYSSMFGAEIRKVKANKNFLFNYEKMLSLVDKKTKLFIVENPNGFIGTQPSMKDIEHCAQVLLKKSCILVVDEAYIYIENDHSPTIKLINKYPNIIIVQTFSKAHGLAGARFGYLIGNSEIIECISKVNPMHEITGPTAIMADWIIDHPELLSQYRNEIKRSIDYLREKCELLGIELFLTKCNFVLMKFPLPANTIYDILKNKYKILIRKPFNDNSLKGWTRVCIGSTSDMKRLINALTEILRK